MRTLDILDSFRSTLPARHGCVRSGSGLRNWYSTTAILLALGLPHYAGAQVTSASVHLTRKAVAQTKAETAPDVQRVDLLSRSYRFTPSRSPLSTLTAQAPQRELPVPVGLTNSFTVELTVDLKKFEGQNSILQIPNVVTVRVRQHDPRDRNRQNYPAFKMSDGSVPVLEATLVLHSTEHPDWKEMTIGIPLAMLRKPEGEHSVVLNFTGVDWKLYVDGDLLDNDFPFGYPQWPEKAFWKLDPQYVKSATLFLPAIPPERTQVQTPSTAPGIQYWLPPGHNNWVGDVETCFYQGRYHVFYLYDRRHHQSKFGCGAHYFEHLSTTDFRTWSEHEAATPLEAQWECIGTGVPFTFHDQLCLSYGWHTTRVYPDERTTLPAQREYLKKHGRTGTFKAGATPGVPAGATYSICTDGVASFKKSQVMFHPCENPSVYSDPDGQLRLLANYRSKGTWTSASIDGGWHCINPDFPPGGDCTIYFRWGKFDYIIGGFTGLWSKPAEAPDAAYEDVAGKGLDFYDGSNVPAITGIAGGRFLMAGWIPIGGWGGVLLIRELIQFPDGRIGSKWMQEITPEVEKPDEVAARISDTTLFPAESKSFLLSLTVQRSAGRTGKMGIAFLPEQGEAAACEVQIRPDDLRAQFGPGMLHQFAPKEKTLREGRAPHHVGNYAIENLIGVDKPFPVRVLVKGDEKIGGTLLDVEIAGQRTMISYRPDLTVRKMVFRTDGAELTDMHVTRLRD